MPPGLTAQALKSRLHRARERLRTEVVGIQGIERRLLMPLGSENLTY
jgi:hypothetical protein